MRFIPEKIDSRGLTPEMNIFRGEGPSRSPMCQSVGKSVTKKLKMRDREYLSQMKSDLHETFRITSSLSKSVDKWSK